MAYCLWLMAYCLWLIGLWAWDTKKERRFSASLSGGGYLLSHFRSTIGVVRLNFSVRNGKRWNPHAITTFVAFGSSDA